MVDIATPAPSSLVGQTAEQKEVTVEDIKAVEAALRKIDAANLERNILARIPQWFLILAWFKDVEVSYACLDDRSSIESKYRAVLTTLMSMGETIIGFCRPNHEDILKLGYTDSMIECNVRYLRDKYEQWFVQYPEEGVQEVLTLLQDERPAAA